MQKEQELSNWIYAYKIRIVLWDVNINKGLLIPHVSVSSVDLSHASNVVLFYCKHSFHEECLPTLDIADVSIGYYFCM
jgi:hypothetical protein